MAPGGGGTSGGLGTLGGVGTLRVADELPELAAALAELDAPIGVVRGRGLPFGIGTGDERRRFSSGPS